MILVQDVKTLLSAAPGAAEVLDLAPFDTFAQLAASLLSSVTVNRAVGEAAISGAANVHFTPPSEPA